MKERQTIIEDEDQNHMEDSSSSIHKEEEEEERVPSFQEGTERSSKKENLALSHDHAVHVISVISYHVTSYHMPHHYCGLYLFKIYCKVEVQSTHSEYEESCKVEKS